MPKEEFVEKWTGNRLFDEKINYVDGCLENQKEIEDLKIRIGNLEKELGIKNAE